MLVERLGFYLQVNHIALLVKIVYIVEEAWSAATAAYYHVFKLSHLMQHVMLYLSESLFATLGKYLRDSLVHASLYIPVKVIELHAELFCQHLANSGLAGSHISYEDYSSHFFAFTGVLSIIFMHSSYVRAAALSCIFFGRR